MKVSKKNENDVEAFVNHKLQNQTLSAAFVCSGNQRMILCFENNCTLTLEVSSMRLREETDFDFDMTGEGEEDTECIRKSRA